MTEGKRSLKKSVLRGSAWTMVGVGASQAMRLGKSLILSRLLFPEAYGVMAIVWAVLYALEMLSDVGIAPAVIRSQRGGRSQIFKHGLDNENHSGRGALCHCLRIGVSNFCVLRATGLGITHPGSRPNIATGGVFFDQYI